MRCFENVAAHLTDDGVVRDRGVRARRISSACATTSTSTPKRSRSTAVALDVGRHDPVDAAARREPRRPQHATVSACHPVVTRYAWPSRARPHGPHRRAAPEERWGGWHREPFTAAEPAARVGLQPLSARLTLPGRLGSVVSGDRLYAPRGRLAATASMSADARRAHVEGAPVTTAWACLCAVGDGDLRYALEYTQRSRANSWPSACGCPTPTSGRHLRPPAGVARRGGGRADRGRRRALPGDRALCQRWLYVVDEADPPADAVRMRIRHTRLRPARGRGRLRVSPREGAAGMVAVLHRRSHCDPAAVSYSADASRLRTSLDLVDRMFTQ